MSQSPRHRIAILISVVSFFGSTVFGAARLVNSALQQPKANLNTATASVQSPKQLQESQLQLQEREYEVVLKQEPNNQTALRGLVAVRLQMKDAKATIQLLEKLVKLNPNQQKYKTLLVQVKQQSVKGDR